MPKKVKDLDPKSRSKKIKGGGLSSDLDHVNRDVGRISKAVLDPVKNSPKTIKGGN